MYVDVSPDPIVLLVGSSKPVAHRKRIDIKQAQTLKQKIQSVKKSALCAHNSAALVSQRPV
jgi:hypothetical protein